LPLFLGFLDCHRRIAGAGYDRWLRRAGCECEEGCTVLVRAVDEAGGGGGLNEAVEPEL